jgi:VPDSG-CTERM motif
MKLKLFPLATFALLSIVPLHVEAVEISTVSLTSFIQDGSVVNDAGSGSSISSIIYSLGTAADGIATWDSGSGGGTASDFLSDPQYFQTVTWSGLNVAPGASFNFGGLDIDLITTLVPLSVTGAVLDETGSSLANGYLTILWANGATGTTALTQQAWSQTQNLTVQASGVPDGGATIALLGLAMSGMAFARRKFLRA